MGLKETIKEMHETIEHITKDLKKSEKGNKAASQRVRTKSIKLAKVAKKYRKESVCEEKKKRKGGAKKATKKKATKKKAATKRKTVKRKPARKAKKSARKGKRRR